MVRRSRFLLLMAGLMLVASVSAHAAQRFERTYLGIRLMSRGINVLRKYGSPTKVLVGDNALFLFLVLRLPDRDFLTVDVGQYDPANPSSVLAPPSSSGPYTPGGSGPYGPGGANSPAGSDSSTSDTGEKKGRLQFWVYEYPKKGLENAFILDEEGRVIAAAQIGGLPSARTTRGVGIGSTYAEIVQQYGFPEMHTKQTIQLDAGMNSGTTAAPTGNPIDLLGVSFLESHGVQFFFMNQRLRGYPNAKGQGPWCVGVFVAATG